MPRPLTVSVDDCGWQSGASLAGAEGPWRLGARDPSLADYQCLARIARRAGTRLVTAWVLSELDRANICARPEYNLPRAPSDMTEQGLAWNNGAHVSDDNFALMTLMRDEAAWLELGLHGVRHEHWKNGRRTRAEFGERNGHGWGNRDAELHVQCFEELLRQYFPPRASRFPVSFVPPNHGYEDEHDGATSTAAVLASHGVRYGQKPGRTSFDHGFLWMSRDTSASPHFDEIATLPGGPPGNATWVMTHLPNFYGEEERWVSWLVNVDRSLGRWLPKNGVEAASQMLYAQGARFTTSRDGGILDTRDVSAQAYAAGVLGPLVLKIARDEEHPTARAFVTAAGGLSMLARYRDPFGHEVIYLGDPEAPRGAVPPGVYEVRVVREDGDVAGGAAGPHVELGAATAHVLGLSRAPRGGLDLALETYGAQALDLSLDTGEVTDVTSASPTLHVESWSWEPTTRLLHLSLAAEDLQGERGTVHVSLGPDSALAKGHERTP